MLKFLKMPAKSDVGIQMAIYILLLFGLVMLTSVSMGDDTGNMTALVLSVVKQLVFITCGYVAMNLVARLFKVNNYSHLIEIIIIATFIALLLPIFFGQEIGGAKAWVLIPFIGVTFQPSEFAKIVIILIVANYLAGIKSSRISGKELVKGPFSILVVYFFIVAILQSDFGSFSIMFVIAVSCFLVCTHPALYKIQRQLLLVGLIGLAFAALILSPLGTAFLTSLDSSSHMIKRFLLASNPFIDPYGDGYQLINGLVSFSTGGLFGRGFGSSVGKYTNFPAVESDFILAIVVEELGFVGFLIIFLCYAFVIYRLFKYALKIKDQKAKVILVGVAMYFFVHFVLNVGGVTALIPLTGVPLLLISAGGTSMVACLMGIGLAQSVIVSYRKGDIV